MENKLKVSAHLVSSDKQTATLGLDAGGKLFDSTINKFPQELYFTNDEEIKEGDLILNTALSIVGKYTHTGNHIWSWNDTIVISNKKLSATSSKKDCRKIVATNNKELWITNPKNAHALTITDIPKIPDSFIPVFIERYNAGNPIREVWLETETKCKYLGAADYYTKEQYKAPVYETVLKLNQDGSVIILPVEDKMISLEEAKFLAKESFKLGFRRGLLNGAFNTSIVDKLFDKNYK